MKHELSIKTLIAVYVLSTVTFFLASCQLDDPIPVVEIESEANEFVYDAMNEWYYYIEQTPELGDKAFIKENDKNTFINQFGSPQELFESLKYEFDRFSFMTDNYNNFLKRRTGQAASYGFRYGLVILPDQNEKLLGYVQYVIPNSIAEEKGVSRGMLFGKVNGDALTLSNYQALLSLSNIRLELAEYKEEKVILTGETINISLQEIEENPVRMDKVFTTRSGTKVGYLLLNSFRAVFNSSVNDAFSRMLAEGVSELILDLRYNPGGDMNSAVHVASMIYGTATENDVLSRISYNKKQSDRNRNIHFKERLEIIDPNYNILEYRGMSRLNLNRVFVLTSRNTASASEVLINGLEPYMEVIQIGQTTLGKNEASVNLFDSPESNFLDHSTANPNHTIGIQPIVSRLANSRGLSDYSNGLTPDIQIDELSYLSELAPLGSIEDPFIDAVLRMVNGQPVRIASPVFEKKFAEIPGGLIETGRYSGIILDDDYILSSSGE